MINVFGSDISEKEISAATQCMESQWVGFGQQVAEFESCFEDVRSLKNFLMVDSGSNALYMACHLLDLPPGSEIILPSLTWVSCAQAVLLCGHKPIFADVDYETLNVTAASIKDVMSKKTAAIMVVHYAGLPCLMDPILDLGLPVIEDAAHAVHATYQNKSCGSIGNIGIYSFDAVKNLTAIEGGGIVLKDSTLYERAKLLRYCGIGKSGFDTAAANSASNWWEYNIHEPFIKMLPTNLHAAVALVQLSRLESLQFKRYQIWQTYDRLLSSVASVSLPCLQQENSTHGLFTYCIKAHNRDSLAKYLLDNGVYTTLRYHPLHLTPLYAHQGHPLHNTERLNHEALSLPLHPRMSIDDAEKVCSLIVSYYRIHG